MRRTHYLAATAVATRLADGLAALAARVAATAVRTAAVAAASLSFKFHFYSSLLYAHKKISSEVLKN